MIKRNGKTMTNVIMGKLKGVQKRAFSFMVAEPELKKKYVVDFKLRFPYKINKEESRYMFMPITLSLFRLGFRSMKFREVPAEFDILLDTGEKLNGKFLVSFPFLLKKVNKNNVEEEDRRVVVYSNRDLEILEASERIDKDPEAFEIYNIKITKEK